MFFRRIIIAIVVSLLTLTASAREPGFPPLVLATDSLQKPWDSDSTHIILPGQRTRITAPALVSHAILGKIYTLRSPDTIVVVTDRFYPNEPDAWRVSLKDIKKYQIPVGYRNRSLVGAIAGACVGAVISTAFALVDSDRRASERAFPYPATITGGGIIGGLAGALSKSERWRTVPVDRLKLGLPLPIEPIPLHTIVVGERVRVFAPGLDKHGYVGSVSAIGDSDIIVAEDYAAGDKNKSRQVRLDQITLYQISVGKRSHTLEGALIGIWSGIFIGDMKASAGEDESTGSVVPFAAIGLVAGAIIGRSIETDIWKVIPAERLRLE
jgi:outer membrane lipoprotein SlyB